VDVRVIAATNRTLSEEVSRKSFREDLYYRLNVLVIQAPPLRERWEDIAVLARYFVDTLKTDTTAAAALSPEALSRMEGYRWPGNVRELENTIRRALVLGRGPQILPADLPPEIGAARAAPAPSAPADGRPVALNLAALEADAIRAALAQTHGKRRPAAQLLGIGEATLYRKLKEYGIEG
jgi:DNA-binding NtrC family response regulator